MRRNNNNNYNYIPEEPIPAYPPSNNNCSPSILERANIAHNNQNVENEAKFHIKYTANQIAYIALREQGLSARAAGKELGLSSGYPAYIDKAIKRKYDLSDSKLVKGAHKTIRNLSQGLPVGTVEKVKDSTALAAAGMIYDRYQPVIHHTNNITDNDIRISIDVSSIQDKQVIDIVDINDAVSTSEQLIDSQMCREEQAETRKLPGNEGGGGDK